MGYKFEREFSFAKNRKRFDFVIHSKKILIEFDGIQHFKEVPYFKNNSLMERQKIDIEKIKLANQYGYRVIRIDYKVKGDLTTTLDKLIKEKKMLSVSNLKMYAWIT